MTYFNGCEPLGHFDYISNFDDFKILCYKSQSNVCIAQANQNQSFAVNLRHLFKKSLNSFYVAIWVLLHSMATG